MDGFLQDLRFGLRSLSQRPGFALIAALALGLGIGANTAIFTVVDAALLRPLPYADPDRLVVVSTFDLPRNLRQATSGADFLDLRAQSQTLPGMAAFREMGFNLSGGDRPERVQGAVVSPDFFEVLGARPLAGRTFTSREPGGPRELVLSESLWRSRFSASPGIVGQTISANGEPFTITGVMPAEVRHPDPVQLWVTPRMRVPDHPLRPRQDTSQDRGSQYLDVVARLRPGATNAQAQSELNLLGQRLEREHPESNAGRSFRVASMRDHAVGNLRPTLLLLSGAVAFILLIACANVANLLLARAVSRSHEVAIRVALGATRAQLLRLFLGESLVLAAAGGGLGLLLALWTAPALAALAPTTVTPQALHLDGTVLAFTAGLALATALVFGLVPALHVGVPAEALKEAGRAGTGGTRPARLRSALVVAEVSLSLVLLIGAGLLVLSFVRLQGVDPGFDPAGASTADVALPAARYPDKQAQSAFFREVVRRLSSGPGVESVGAVSRLPLSGGNSSRDFVVESNPDANLHADYRVATPGYFAALRIPLRAGRVFTQAETDAPARVVLVNEALAKMAFAERSPLGQRLIVTLDEKPVEVVGVVGNVKHAGLDSAPRPELYLPPGLEEWPSMTLVARGRGDLPGLLRGEVAAVDRDQAVARVEGMEQRLAASLGPRRFGVLLIGMLASVAFLLAVTGIYGVMSYSVAQRTREMGIRLALGATPGAVLRLVLGQAMRLVAGGVLLGVAGALSLGGVIRTLLFGVSPADPSVFAALVALLCGTAALAALVAARRATTVDPVLALRAE